MTAGAGSRPLLSRVDPRCRLVGLLAFALTVVLLRDAAGLIVAVLAAATAVGLAGMGVGDVLRRLSILEGFAVITLISLPFTIPGDPAFVLFGLPLSAQGLSRAGEILLRINGVALMALALLHGLEVPQIGHSLRRLGLPDKLVQLLLFTVRYLDLLKQEYTRLRTAMRARAFTLGCNRHGWRTLGWLFGMLMVRSVDRSERVLAAMRCRGFAGRFPVLDPPGRLGRGDGVFVGLGAAVLAIVLII